MIIQSIALLDQLDKDINTFSMRIRWEVQLVFSDPVVNNMYFLGSGILITSQS